MKSKKDNSAIIARNKKARHEYFVEQTLQAGLVLEGWEVKSLRAKKANLEQSYILLKQGEAWLFGAHFSPLTSASTHITPDPLRSRKLLLHKKELNQLIGAIQRKGFTCVPLSLYWHKGFAKCEVALAKGKKLYDKRATEKAKDWQREKDRLSKQKYQ